MEKTTELPKFNNPEEEIAYLREQISKTEKHLRDSKAEYNIDDVEFNAKQSHQT